MLPDFSRVSHEERSFHMFWLRAALLQILSLRLNYGFTPFFSPHLLAPYFLLDDLYNSSVLTYKNIVLAVLTAATFTVVEVASYRCHALHHLN